MDVLRDIPTEPRRYQRWLKKTRKTYEALEQYWDRYVFALVDTPSDPTPSKRRELLQPPSELPRPDKILPGHTFLIDLDNETLTIDYCVESPLGSIPPVEGLYRLVVPDDNSNARSKHVAHLTSPTTASRGPAIDFNYDFRVVTPKADVGDARKRWLVRIAAEFISEYDRTVHRFGRQWMPRSLPFRELTYALLWILSGKAKFLSFPDGYCHPRDCAKHMVELPTCLNDIALDLPDTGYFDRGWAGDSAPLLEFGSLFHAPGRPAGISSQETRYWFDGVLISLVLDVDGGAVNEAVSWALQQGRENFQLLVLSLFEVILAEVSTVLDPDGTKKPFVKVCGPLSLPPLPEEESDIVHPTEGRVLYPPAALQSRLSRTDLYPGLAALINFFDVAGHRRAAAKSNGVLPAEIYCRIIDHVDHDTWRACSVVSPAFRAYCLFKYRIDDEWRIVSTAPPRSSTPFCSVDMEEMSTGDVIQMDEEQYWESCWALPTCNWMPIVGEEPRALMVDVLLRFEEVGVARFGEGRQCDCCCHDS